MSSTIFVVAATGALGKAVALDLAKGGWKVKTTTRNAGSPAARDLAAAGVELISASWDDQEALEKAIAGCHGVFINMIPDFGDLTADARQGKNIMAIAKAAGVKHVIHSSGVGIDKPERIEGFDPQSLIAATFASKRAVEEATRTAGLETYTILRPASFMSNWLLPKVFVWGGFHETGVFDTVLQPDTRLALIDEKDFGAFVTAAFNDPARFNGVETDVASEMQTIEDVLKIVSEAAGQTIKPHYLSDEETRVAVKENPFMAGQYLSRTMFQSVDMDAIKNFGVPLHTLKEYLARERDAVAQTYSKKSE